MPNKYFRMLNAFRKAVKQLPKDLSNAFDITDYELNNVKFSIVNDNKEIVENKTRYHKVLLTAIAPDNAVQTIKPVSIKLSDDQYVKYKEDGITNFTKDVVVYNVSLCQELQTIGQILEKDLFSEQKVLFKDSEIFGMQLEEISYMTADEYKKKLGKNLEILVKNFKNV